MKKLLLITMLLTVSSLAETHEQEAERIRAGIAQYDAQKAAESQARALERQVVPRRTVIVIDARSTRCAFCGKIYSGAWSGCADSYNHSLHPLQRRDLHRAHVVSPYRPF